MVPKTKSVRTLCIIHQQPRILLGLKKRGFGAGKWNGFGGKIEAEETIEQAARRETFEEAGIGLGEITKVGLLVFSQEGRSEVHKVHVFLATEFSGVPVETEEMKPQWFATSDIPFQNMWADDVHWFPLLLSGKRFRGTFLYAADGTILEQELNQVDALF